MSQLEMLDQAVDAGVAMLVTPDRDRTCGKVVLGPGWSRDHACGRVGRWEFPGSSFTGRMCTQHGASFARHLLAEKVHTR